MTQKLNTQKSPLVLMIVMRDVTRRQEVDRLWSIHDAYLHVSALGVEHSTPQALKSVKGAGASHGEIQDELRRMNRGDLDEVLSREFSLVRLGHGVGHPGRVVGFWMDGVVHSEEGAPLPSEEELSKLLSVSLREITTAVVEGHLAFRIEANRAFA